MGRDKQGRAWGCRQAGQMTGNHLPNSSRTLYTSTGALNEMSGTTVSMQPPPCTFREPTPASQQIEKGTRSVGSADIQVPWKSTGQIHVSVSYWGWGHWSGAASVLHAEASMVKKP
jgi:hypothetical protein